MMEEYKADDLKKRSVAYDDIKSEGGDRFKKNKSLHFNERRTSSVLGHRGSKGDL